MKPWGNHFWSVVVIAAVLTGCGGGSNSRGAGAPPADGSVGGGGGSPPVGGNPIAATSTLSGTMMGGAAPISGSTVSLFQAGDGIGAALVSLGTSTSDTHGNFSISFTNPGASSIIYLVAAGGDAGNGPNSAIQLALMLGPAGNLSSTPVMVNEVTSVAMGYALKHLFNPRVIITFRDRLLA